MYHPGLLLVVITSIIIPSSLGAPQSNVIKNHELMSDSIKLGLPSDAHHIQKRFFRTHHQPIFTIPRDQQFRAWARMGDLMMMQHVAFHEHKENGINIIDSQDSRNWTALLWASRYGHHEVVDWLLEHGASVSLQNNQGDSALLWAVGGGHATVVELLMQKDADPNLPENNGLTPVGVAAAMNRETELRIMDKYGHLDLEHKNNDGRTPLNLAASVGQASMVLLLGHVGNIDDADNNDMTPSHWAMNLRDTSTLKACLLLCPDLDLRDDRNNTALDVAIAVQNTEGEQIIRDFMDQPLGGCWLDGEEHPPKAITFFDCKQIQCMCQGYWGHTGVFDPTCLGRGDASPDSFDGNSFVTRRVNVVARQEIQRYDLNKTYVYATTVEPIFADPLQDDHDDGEEDDHLDGKNQYK